MVRRRQPILQTSRRDMNYQGKVALEKMPSRKADGQQAAGESRPGTVVVSLSVVQEKSVAEMNQELQV